MRARTLTTWWSQSRGDNVSTTDPEWERGDPAPGPAGYSFVRAEGEVLAPNLTHQPSGARRLSRWWSGARRDNFTTSDPAWQDPSSPPAGSGYRFARHEGYILERPFAGTDPLGLWWSARSTDNHTTTHPSWREGSPGIPTEYRFGGVQGWVRRAHGGLPTEDPEPFGFTDKERRGLRGLLVVICEYTDRVIDETAMGDLAEGGRQPSLVGMFQSLSGGRFSWSPVQVARVRFDEPIAEATSSVAEHDVKAVHLAVEQAGADLAAYDTDGDGVVGGDDLVVMTVVADGVVGGQTRGLATLTAGGVTVRGVSLSANGDGSDISSFTHELVHTLRLDQHIYGPGASLNYRASCYAASTARASARAGPVHLDSWNRILAGWARPRVMPISLSGGVAALPAAQVAAASPHLGPLLFHDPRRGKDEFLLVEYRTPRAACAPPYGNYDSAVLGQGIAVWYVRRGPDGLAVGFDWPPPVVPKPGGNMVANFLIGPDGMGKGPFWRREHGVIALRWPDMTDTGLRLRIGSLEEGSSFAYVMWWHSGTPFLPRLDRVTPDRVLPGASRTIELEGVFPLEESLRIELGRMGAPGSVRPVAEVSSGTDVDRIEVSVSLPRSRGWYELFVTRSDGSRSNGALINIQ